ncbi:MAG: ATP-binding protein, partial [Acidimicrobiales bacterium]
RHATTMETRGQVASTIAHDFNNLLTLITGYAEVLEGQVTSSESAGLVRAIQVTAARAAALTAQLQSIGRTHEGRPVVVDPRAALGANADVLERVLGPAIALTWSWAPSIGRVRVDPDQLEQVLLNLAINARDAMPDGGRLSITVDEVDHDDRGGDADDDDREDGGRPARRGRDVRVRVVDTGVGMDEETRQRCFEPLFTTKGPLSGTGMGLASAKRTIEESGGSIRVDSRPGAGTTVEFVLPVVDEPLDEPAVVDASAPAPTTAPRGRSAAVLLVEDDEALRRLVGAVLRRHGHRVFDAPGVEEARALVAARDEPFELLVSDVVLGEGRGDELARALRAAQPGLAILLTSGSADATVLGDLAAPAAFLAKPFKPSQVIDEVVALLRP